MTPPPSPSNMKKRNLRLQSLSTLSIALILVATTTRRLKSSLFDKIDVDAPLEPQLSPRTGLGRPLPCKLESHPTPMILMSLGRSGTASMYQVLSKLSGGDETPRIIEYTGGSTSKSKEFFMGIPHNDTNGDWLMKFVCHEQRQVCSHHDEVYKIHKRTIIIYYLIPFSLSTSAQHPNAGIIGFKWKPYETIFSENKAIDGLKLLSRLQEPQIKVIRSRLVNYS